MVLIFRYIFLSGIILALQSATFFLNAQDRCGTEEYLRSVNPDHQLQKTKFEKWLGEQIPLQKISRGARSQAPPYKIPVVVHVIHNGEPIGTGPNISEAQILSQIKVINADFNRKNSDAIKTPPEFAALAGSVDLEFVLAKRNPDGLATNGIVRVNGGRNSWTMNDNYALKSTSYWAAEQYLNIWVCNLTDKFVGYAQFPISNLPGLETSSSNRLTDGVVIWYKAFGSVDDGAFNLDPSFNKGRTVTHETGHFFGLRHIWGDESNCTGTDYVMDTPNQAGSTDGCPVHPKKDSCGEVIMFQNFLDYSDDNCMNLFTQGQVNRMVTVIENSPRRKSLLTSPGLLLPNPLPNDLGIRNIVFPDATVCSSLITPVIEIRNYGNNLITSAQIRLTLDGTVQEIKNYTINLNPQESVLVNFSPVSVTSGKHDFIFEILLTNGGADGSNANNTLSTSANVPAFINAPFVENFNTPSGWIIQNPDGQITWQVVIAPKESQINKALQLNCFDYEDKVGEIDTYLSPVINLTSALAATLTFDVAHARFQFSNDRLKVVALKNCEDISKGTVVYDKTGASLATAPATTMPFTPSGEAQWRKELINLSAFIGADKVQLAFIGINDWGNNIYLDNITLITEKTVDVSLISLAKPSVVTCEESVFPKILIQNVGTVALVNFDVEYRLNNGATQMVKISNLNLGFGEEQEIELPKVNFSDGSNTLIIVLKNPNGSPDNNPGNNQKEFTVVINKVKDRIPLRENFDGNFASSWTTVNPEGGMNWKTISTNYNQSLYFNAYNNGKTGDEAWLVSPVLDFSQTNAAGLLFDLSNAIGNGGKETLTILGSKDCGTTFFEIPYNFPGVKTLSESWLPKNPGDWERNVSVNLNALAGEVNGRVAFVVRNQNGNNFYLDNIEFFTTADPDTLEIQEIYSIYGYDLTNSGNGELKITFNLPERQDVRYTLISTTGKIEGDLLLTDVLNQTFPLNVSQRLAQGMYFVRLKIGKKYYTSRILITD